MGFFKNIKSGLRSLKWVASKNGRQYIKNQKVDRKGIKDIAERNEKDEACDVPPEGWECTRAKGHGGNGGFYH